MCFSKKLLKIIYKWESLKVERKTEPRINLYIKRKEHLIMEETMIKSMKIYKTHKEYKII